MIDTAAKVSQFRKPLPSATARKIAGRTQVAEAKGHVSPEEVSTNRPLTRMPHYSVNTIVGNLPAPQGLIDEGWILLSVGRQNRFSFDAARLPDEPLQIR